MAIVVNKPIPEFEANATGGIKVTNTSHNGQVLVLYFYPKDNTPGCTTADILSLPYDHRRRPMFPFEPDMEWKV